MIVLYITILVALTLFYAWRYARITVDPDWAMFNLQAFTGSRYGRDFVDCKTPAIHWWYYGIASVVGADVWRVRFTHHVLIGLGSVVVFAITGNFWVALALLVLTQSGWLYAFHGNVGQQPAVLIAIALAMGNEWAVIPWALALAFEPKLSVSFAAWVVIGGFWMGGAGVALFAGAVALLIRTFDKEYWKWLIEANLVIPRRMQQQRVTVWRQLFTMGTHGPMYLYFLPWVFLAVSAHTALPYWFPAVLFAAVTYYGVAVRPNHLIPLAAWMALTGIAPPAVLALLVIDLVAGQLYLGDIWKHFYFGLYGLNLQAKWCGEWLRDKPGTLWVNDLHSGIYIYARKPVQYGMAEQIEIRETAHERRKTMVQLWKERPADWVVNGPEAATNFNASGYKKVAETRQYAIYKRSR